MAGSGVGARRGPPSAADSEPGQHGLASESLGNGAVAGVSSVSAGATVSGSEVGIEVEEAVAVSAFGSGCGFAAGRRTGIGTVPVSDYGNHSEIGSGIGMAFAEIETVPGSDSGYGVGIPTGFEEAETETDSPPAEVEVVSEAPAEAEAGA